MEKTIDTILRIKVEYYFNLIILNCQICIYIRSRIILKEYNLTLEWNYYRQVMIHKSENDHIAIQ